MDRKETARTVARFVLAGLMVMIGVKHFTDPEPFVKIVPAQLPEPRLLVHVSGVFEILGGLGLLLARTRRAASLGLVALYLAVFPANVNMAVNQLPFGDMPVAPALLWLRLPMQVVFIAWAWWVGLPSQEKKQP